MTDDDTVIACANCDNSRISKDTAPSYQGGPATENLYYCRECGGLVETIRRPPKDSANPECLSGMAKVLAETDPDEAGL